MHQSIRLLAIKPYKLSNHLRNITSYSTDNHHSHSARPDENIVYLGLGSNVGDRLRNISNAINSLSHLNPSTRLLDSSFVYQSEPMYVSDQPDFLNAACKISTPLNPQELLKLIKIIEVDQGRKLQNVPRNGPRPIDIDILLYNSEIIKQENLIIPHIGILERQFVLDPLTDVARQTIHPGTQMTIGKLLADFKSNRPGDEEGVKKLYPIQGVGSRTLDLSTRTHLMSIVNCTPDSFSDGGDSLSLEDGIQNSLSHVRAGADILDIGGMSSRPGASLEVSVDTEIGRTVPLIRALREQHKLDCHISIDTFRAATAKAAIQAGATIVNDISGGDADEEMLSTVAKLDVPYILMHMRGNSRTMSTMTSYKTGDVVNEVRRELEHKVRRALSAGIKRWNLIIDPGFGFAKDLSGNCQLLNSLNSLQRSSVREPPNSQEGHSILEGFPLLVGLSRKKFLAQLLTPSSSASLPDPKDRLVPTIVASTIAICNGANLIRAHDTLVTKQVIQTVDGIRTFASPSSPSCD
ncbi:hypothetical protein PSHT_04186 [Puccinia striiformis]|nr:hypothetical protein PSHT_04186 [Puccinia striiformis]